MWVSVSNECVSCLVIISSPFMISVTSSLSYGPHCFFTQCELPHFLSPSTCGTFLVFLLCSALLCICGTSSPVRLSNRGHCWASMQLTSPWYSPLTWWWCMCFSSICCTFVLRWTRSFLIHTSSEFPSTFPNATVFLSVEAFTLHFSNNSFLRPSQVTTGSGIFTGALPKADSPSVLVHLLGSRGSHFLWEKPQS